MSTKDVTTSFHSVDSGQNKDRDEADCSTLTELASLDHGEVTWAPEKQTDIPQGASFAVEELCAI